MRSNNSSRPPIEGLLNSAYHRLNAIRQQGSMAELLKGIMRVNDRRGNLGQVRDVLGDPKSPRTSKEGTGRVRVGEETINYLQISR